MSIESPENKKNKFELFKERISDLIRTEKKKMDSGKNYNPHLVGMDPEELSEEDMDIYEKFENRTLTFKEISKFRKDVNLRASQKTEKIEPTAEEIAIYEKYKKKGMTKEEFLDYWDKEVPTAEFWAYWKRKMAGDEESKFGDPEENFYAYLDNEIEKDKKFWMKKFAEEPGGKGKTA
jgi:hypothetical protein